jgi:apolipoprotein N-acyltransferase
VPFSEHVPFKYSWTGLHKLLRMAVPEQMPQLDPGEGDFRFYLRRGGESIQLITPICYEGSIGQVCRRMVAAGPKDRLVMINLSNDGWFVYGSRQGGYRGTTEHAQHLMHYPLRAVENRVPIARAVNTGISALIDSAGRIQSVLETDAPDGRQRTMVTGTLRGRLNIDPRTPLYIRIGDTFGLGVCIAAAGLLAGLAWTSTKRSRGTME